MTNNEESPINSDIQQEFIEILNKTEVLSSFNDVFQKYGLSAKKITMNFVFSDLTQPQTRESFQADEALLAPLAENSWQFKTIWCPAPPCPPPGRWVG